MTMALLDLIANVTPLVLQLPLAVVMVRHNGHERYRLFFAYTIFSVVVTALRLALLHWPTPYFIAYCAGEFLYGLLALLAIAEVFQVRLQLIYEKYKFLRYMLLPATLLTVAIIGGWRALYHPFGPSLLGHLTSGVWGFVIGIRALESGLYFAGWALRKTGKITLADRPFNILKGFGLAAFFSLFAYLARYRFGPELEPVFRYLPFGAYIASSVLWLRTFLQPEPPHTMPAPELKRVQGLLEFMQEEWKSLGKLKIKFGSRLGFNI